MFEQVKAFTAACDGDCRQAISLGTMLLTALIVLIGLGMVARALSGIGKRVGALADTVAAGTKDSLEARTWRRAEFVANEMKEFHGDAAVRRVLSLADSTVRSLDMEVQPGIVRPVTFAQEQSYLAETVDPDRHVVLTAALQPHEKKPNFTRLEAAYRDDVNHFLGWLERFEGFIKTGLVGFGDMEPHLRYWVDLLNGGKGHVSRPYLESLRQYAAYYQYNDALAFLMRGVPSAAGGDKPAAGH